MKYLVIAVVCMVMAGGVAWADSTASSNAVGVGVGIGGQQQQQQGQQTTQTANPSATVTQTFEATKLAPGQYRSIPEMIIPGNVTIPAFFGPFVPGWKILDDLTSITKLSKSEAENLGGGAKCILKLKSKVKWETDIVRFIVQYDPKTMPEPSGWIFCTSNGETTIDVMADAAKIAMGEGGTDLVLLKHKVEYSTSGWGIFLSGGVTAGKLVGSEKDGVVSGGGVSGLGYGKTKGNTEDGIIFGMIRK